MEKIALRIICALLCIFTSLAANAAPYRCIASKLNIRDTADKSGRVIGQIAQNETVDILSADGKWGSVLINGDTGYVSMDYMEPFETSSNQGESVEKPWTDAQQAIFWICVVIAVAIYVFAVVKVRQGEMVVIRGWLDFALLMFPWLVVFLHLYDAFLGGVIFGKYVIIALYVIAGLCLIGSLALSVISNWGSPFYVIFSLIMKLVVIPIMAFGFFYLIFKIWENRGLSRKAVIIFLVLGILIGGLMSFEE